MARPSATVLAIGLSRNTCLPASAAALVVSRCTLLGVVLTIASMEGSARISSYLAAARQPYLAAKARRLSSERVKQAASCSMSERLMASASTSDHQPIPKAATRSGAWLTAHSLPTSPNAPANSLALRLVGDGLPVAEGPGRALQDQQQTDHDGNDDER